MEMSDSNVVPATGDCSDAPTSDVLGLFVSVNGGPQQRIAVEPGTDAAMSTPLEAPARKTEADVIAAMEKDIAEARRTKRRFAVCCTPEWLGFKPFVWVCVDTVPEAIEATILLNSTLRTVLARFTRTFAVSTVPGEDSTPVYVLGGTASAEDGACAPAPDATAESSTTTTPGGSPPAAGTRLNSGMLTLADVATRRD